MATRKLAVPVDNAREKVRLYSTLPVVQVDVPMILAAIDLHERQRLAFWDALVVQAAAMAGCTELVSEDPAARTSHRRRADRRPVPMRNGSEVPGFSGRRGRRR